jgi:hypothetical protein
MPAIALPQLRPDLKKTVKYPIPPANPPTFKDVAAAINLSHEVMAARRLCHHTLNDWELTLVSWFLERSEASDEELVKVYRYQLSLVSSDEGKFHPALLTPFF